MDTLFTAMENERKQQVAPLAVRMRPRTLEDVVGQADAVAVGRPALLDPSLPLRWAHELGVSDEETRRPIQYWRGTWR